MSLLPWHFPLRRYEAYDTILTGVMRGFITGITIYAGVMGLLILIVLIVNGELTLL